MDPTLEARFWSRVDKSGDCWLWTGSVLSRRGGYGRIALGGRYWRAHRLAWELSGRSLINGLTLDHLCRNRLCVNPDHLEQVTRGENVMRGDTLPAANLRKTHCKNGHPLSGSNVISETNHGRPSRRCRTCSRAWQRAYYLGHVMAHAEMPEAAELLDALQGKADR